MVKLIEIVCERCGKIFSVFPSLAKGRKHCSRKCLNLTRAKVKVICKECGKTFSVPQNRIKRSVNYCSKDCQYKSKEWRRKMSETKKGERNPNYGKIYSAEERRRQSLVMKGKHSGEKNPMYGKPPEHHRNKWRKLGFTTFGHLVRSSWEFYFAKLLQENNILYFYEPKTFRVVIDGKKTTYTPDFYIPEQNNGGLWILPFPQDVYVELKGYLRERDKKKINYFKKHYGNLILIDKSTIKNYGHIFKCFF